VSQYLPINLKISDYSCLVVGGGKVALRKGRGLLDAGARVTFISPDFIKPIQSLAKESSEISLIESDFNMSSLTGYRLVIAATDNPEVNMKVSEIAEKENVLVNVVDEPALCRFISPAVVNRGPLSIAISSQGAAPVLARMLKEKIELALPSNLGKLLKSIAVKRVQVMEKYSDFSKRKSLWESYFENLLDWKKTQFLNVARNKLLSEEFTVEQLSLQCAGYAGKLFLMDAGEEIVGRLSLDFVGACQKVDRLILLTDMDPEVRTLVRKDVLDYRVEESPESLFTGKNSILEDIKNWVKAGEKVVVYSSGYVFESQQETIENLISRSFDSTSKEYVFTVKV